MTYFTTAPSYRAHNRSRLLPQPNRVTGGTWVTGMLCGLLALLYARGLLTEVHYRRGLKRLGKHQAYQDYNFELAGCDHFRAALTKQDGYILGDFKLHDAEPSGYDAFGCRRFCEVHRATLPPGFNDQPLSGLHQLASNMTNIVHIRGSPTVRVAPA